MPFHWSEDHVRLPWILTGLAGLIAAGVFLIALRTVEDIAEPAFLKNEITASHELDIVSSQIIGSTA
jgi:hypothetical protein